MSVDDLTVQKIELALRNMISSFAPEREAPGSDDHHDALVARDALQFFLDDLWGEETTLKTRAGTEYQPLPEGTEIVAVVVTGQVHPDDEDATTHLMREDLVATAVRRAIMDARTPEMDLIVSTYQNIAKIRVRILNSQSLSRAQQGLLQMGVNQNPDAW